jgi:hypothetical protein
MQLLNPEGDDDVTKAAGKFYEASAVNFATSSSSCFASCFSSSFDNSGFYVNPSLALEEKLTIEIEDIFSFPLYKYF